MANINLTGNGRIMQTAPKKLPMPPRSSEEAKADGHLSHFFLLGFPQELFTANSSLDSHFYILKGVGWGEVRSFKRVSYFSVT